jgi:hypothetical protein
MSAETLRAPRRGTASQENRSFLVSDRYPLAVIPRIKRVPNRRPEIDRITTCGNSTARDCEIWSSRRDGPTEKPVLKAKKV